MDVISMIHRYILSKKGLSLVEVLLSSALLLLVFGAFISGYYYSVNLRADSQSRLQAMLKAQACIEEIRGFRGNLSGEWSDTEELKTWLENVAYTESEAGVFTNGNVTITIEQDEIGLPEKLISVSVEVSYSEQMSKGKTKSVKLHTRLREF